MVACILRLPPERRRADHADLQFQHVTYAIGPAFQERSAEEVAGIGSVARIGIGPRRVLRCVEALAESEPPSRTSRVPPIGQLPVQPGEGRRQRIFR
jgi:hypothetical protein